MRGSRCRFKRPLIQPLEDRPASVAWTTGRAGHRLAWRGCGRAKSGLGNCALLELLVEASNLGFERGNLGIQRLATINNGIGFFLEESHSQLGQIIESGG